MTLQETQKTNIPICGRCKKPCIDVAYVEVHAAVILNGIIPPAPQIFYCQESAENFAQRIPMHPTCWISTLEDHGVKLHDMDKVFADISNKQNQLIKEKKKQKK